MIYGTSRKVYVYRHGIGDLQEEERKDQGMYSKKKNRELSSST